MDTSNADDSRDPQARVLAFLADPATHGEPVQRVDTHGASVFLASERAYKLKRAVRFSYLDFSTLEQRRAVCLRELELNRRIAPGLYLEVVPIVERADTSLAFGAPSQSGPEILDWVVVMRRFQDRDLLATMVREGRLEPLMVRDLADTIAHFHQHDAHPVLDDGVSRVRRVIEGNRQSMAATGTEILDPEACQAWMDESLAELAQASPVLRARAAKGWIRHGHGDLHLGNICLWEGTLTPFDCLEFNDEFAISDVLYDLAFAVMDLWHRGHHDLASLLTNRYLDLVNMEPDALTVFPLFLSMRAAVRAHVLATQATQARDKERGLALQQVARSYLAEARDFLVPYPPRLVAVGGFSGTGKSTLAANLAPEVGAVPGARWLRTDVLRKTSAGVAPETRLPETAYSRSNSDAVYVRLLSLAEQTLRAGCSVIVDGVFARASERQAFLELADKVGVRFDGLWLEASREALRSRIEGRINDASDANIEVLDRQLQMNLGDLAAWHCVCAEGSPQDVAEAAKRAL
ncbi:bifunctional aminoglycoside phosphotransferase/ATP-binding protein [Novosphingobium sp. BW1]|uniref:bifunctional aminoglycoside phosphotransferase/ATP-binding protein n=1 Tax=Novosphingobium sp. BW1 TaxID=2592621 RepID=UPI0011DEF74D|nr:bifunctional aminoglycoside phosphotransferase/ATP-binding protein [Novosphingobium sp. BW1]TYC90853.1 AAA family ATPase [Novosphingobium sp. BW1]